VNLGPDETVLWPQDRPMVATVSNRVRECCGLHKHPDRSIHG
jgi:hypothetical protein